MTFTIDSDNNIAVLAEQAGAAPSNSFSGPTELSKLTAEWPISRLVETWNSFAGVAPFDDLRPVKKFTNRKVAVDRICRAIERLAPNCGDTPQHVAPQTAHVAPSKGSRKKAATAKKKRAVAHPRAKHREGSKKLEVLKLLQRKQGATLDEITQATDWQPHTVRGFISGTLGKKMGLTVESTRSEKGVRTYRIAG